MDVLGGDAGPELAVVAAAEGADLVVEVAALLVGHDELAEGGLGVGVVLRRIEGDGGAVEHEVEGGADERRGILEGEEAIEEDAEPLLGELDAGGHQVRIIPWPPFPATYTR